MLHLRPQDVPAVYVDVSAMEALRTLIHSYLVRLEMVIVDYGRCCPADFVVSFLLASSRLGIAQGYKEIRKAIQRLGRLYRD